VMERGLGD